MKPPPCFSIVALPWRGNIPVYAVDFSNVICLPQQNNMSQTSAPIPPSYGPSSNCKPNRLYQQLMSSNYLHDHIYEPSIPQSHPATIKFSTQLPPPKLLQTLESWEKEQQDATSPRKNCDSSAKTSHQVTQSLGSNYSIIEMENQSYSTVNLYSLSRNHIEPDLSLSLSSNQVTEQLNHGLPSHSKQSRFLLEDSGRRNDQVHQEVSCLELQDRMKKYRSEEFQSIEEPRPDQQQQEKSPLPRLLADRYIKNDINRKFASSQASEHEEGNFKTVLNEVYVVPYKINQQVQPYAFSLPVDSQRGSQHPDRKSKAASLNLNRSRQSEANQEQKQPNPLYFSSHANKYRPQPIIITHTPLLSEHRQERPIPKSEPKEYHYSNQKTARSNSIGCKSKPVLAVARSEQDPVDRLDNSRVVRIFKQEDKAQPKPVQENSIIYHDSEVNLCCSLGRDKNANRINFSNKSGGFFCDEVPDEGSPTNNGSKRITGYKINPLAVIKGKQEPKEGESQKKGLKLVGFHPSFPRKE